MGIKSGGSHEAIEVDGLWLVARWGLYNRLMLFTVMTGGSMSR